VFTEGSIGARLGPARGRRPGVVVMGLHVNGVGVVHTVARAGVAVVGLDARPRQPGFRSRLARTAVSPNPEKEPAALLAFLRRLAAGLEGRWVLLPTNDEYAEFIAREQAALAPHFAFAALPPDTLGLVSDKWRFHGVVARLGIPGPATICPGSADELGARAGGLAFPCIVKPIMTSMWKGTGRGKAVVAGTPAELLDHYRRLTSRPGDLVVQELIPGGDETVHFYFAYYDRTGRPRSEFTARKIRQYPPRFGTTCLAESRWVPEIADTSRRLLAALDYRGLVDVEFKRDPRDGVFKIIEVNARIGLQHQLAAAAGANLPLAAWHDLAGVSGPPAPPPRDGVKWMILDRDLESAAHYLRRGELTPADWLASLRGVRSVATLDWRDPRPFLSLFGAPTIKASAVILAACAAGVLRSVVRRVRGPRPRRGAAPRPAADTTPAGWGAKAGR
jgi:D-aspartate ligase